MSQDENDANERARKARKGSPYLFSKEVAARLRIQINTLEKMRARQRGPKFSKDGHLVRYHIEDVEAYEVQMRSLHK